MSGLEPFVRNLVETPQGFTHFISSVLFWEFIIGALRTDSASRITNALPNPGNKNNRFHLEVQCWYKDKDNEKKKNKQIKHVNNSKLEVDLNDHDPKN